ncbi:hypothetical protein Droror1_Dr00011706 [Drosera rotundifolia]
MSFVTSNEIWAKNDFALAALLALSFSSSSPRAPPPPPPTPPLPSSSFSSHLSRRRSPFPIADAITDESLRYDYVNFGSVQDVDFLSLLCLIF